MARIIQTNYENISKQILNLCRFEDFNEVDELLNEHKKIDLNYVDEHNNTALILACESNKNELALKILDYNCNINNINHYDDNALLIACKNKMWNTVLKLLEHCDIKHINKNNNCSVITYVLQNNNIELINRLIEFNYYDKEIFYWSIKNKNTEIGLKILNKCIIHEFNNNILLLICENNLEEIGLKYLIKYKNIINDKIINYKNINNNTSIILACKNNMKKIALKLLDYECNLKQANNLGETVLLWACKNKMKNIIWKILTKYLMKQNNNKTFRNTYKYCNIEQISNNEETAFGIACLNNLPETIILKMLEFNELDVLCPIKIHNNLYNKKQNIKINSCCVCFHYWWCLCLCCCCSNDFIYDKNDCCNCGSIKKKYDNTTKYLNITKKYYFKTPFILLCENKKYNSLTKIYNLKGDCVFEDVFNKNYYISDYYVTYKNINTSNIKELIKNNTYLHKKYILFQTKKFGKNVVYNKENSFNSNNC